MFKSIFFVIVILITVVTNSFGNCNSAVIVEAGRHIGNDTLLLFKYTAPNKPVKVYLKGWFNQWIDPPVAVGFDVLDDCDGNLIAKGEIEVYCETDPWAMFLLDPDQTIWIKWYYDTRLCCSGGEFDWEIKIEDNYLIENANSAKVGRNNGSGYWTFDLDIGEIIEVSNNDAYIKLYDITDEKLEPVFLSMNSECDPASNQCQPATHMALSKQKILIESLYRADIVTDCDFFNLYELGFNLQVESSSCDNPIPVIPGNQTSGDSTTWFMYEAPDKPVRIYLWSIFQSWEEFPIATAFNVYNSCGGNILESGKIDWVCGTNPRSSLELEPNERIWIEWYHDGEGCQQCKKSFDWFLKVEENITLESAYEAIIGSNNGSGYWIYNAKPGQQVSVYNDDSFIQLYDITNGISDSTWVANNLPCNISDGKCDTARFQSLSNTTLLIHSEYQSDTSSDCDTFSGYELGFDLSVEEFVLSLPKSEKEAFKVFPNPSCDFIVISDYVEEGLLKDQFGNVVKKMASNSKKLSVAELSPGIYYFEYFKLSTDESKYLRILINY